MYPALLIIKYLRTKLAPLFAAVAVTLCTAMVILVISVMGGFLDMLKESAKQLTGDIVIVTPSLTGFPHYEEIQKQLLAEPEFVATTPVIRSFGLFNGFGVTKGIEVIGIEPPSFSKVVKYEDSLYWSVDDALRHYEHGFFEPLANRAENADEIFEARKKELQTGFDLNKSAMTFEPPTFNRLRGPKDLRFPRHRMTELGNRDAMGIGLDPYNPESKSLPGVVLGIEVSPDNRRDAEGQYSFENSRVDFAVNITVVPLDGSGDLGAGTPAKSSFLIVNEYKSGLYDVDAASAFIEFDRLQRMLKMEATTISFDSETGEPISPPIVVPGRCSQIVCKTAPGTDLLAARAKADTIIDRVNGKLGGISPYVRAITWEQEHAQLLSAVKNEKGMITFLFAIISVVAIVMVATTFYMIVLEKTRDIGTLRAIGASATGVLSVFLGYGLLIGVLGSLAGTGIAIFIVNHLNELQAALGHRMSTLIASTAAIVVATVVLLIALIIFNRRRDNLIEWTVWPTVAFAAVLICVVYIAFPAIQIPPLTNLDNKFGWMMWDPSLYYFDRIPARIAPPETAAIAIGAVISSVVGAFIPAVIAAFLKPMEALRYE